MNQDDRIYRRVLRVVAYNTDNLHQGPTIDRAHIKTILSGTGNVAPDRVDEAIEAAVANDDLVAEAGGYRLADGVDPV